MYCLFLARIKYPLFLLPLASSCRHANPLLNLFLSASEGLFLGKVAFKDWWLEE